MSTERTNSTIKLLKCALVITVMSQILVPIYSDRNFLALAEGGLVQRVCLEDVEHYPSDKCQALMQGSSLYDSLIFTTHVYFGDLGLLIFQVFIMLLISRILAKVVLDQECKNQSFQFFLYLISLVAIFYGRDISPDHFVVLGVLLIIRLLYSLKKDSGDLSSTKYGISSLVKAILVLYLVLTTFLLWDSSQPIPLSIAEFKIIFESYMLERPVGQDLSLAMYSLAVSFLMLLLTGFTLSREKLRILQVLVACLLFMMSFISPLIRMLCPIYSLLVIAREIDGSQALTNMSSLFDRFVNSTKHLSGYALIFFLLAFSFSQAEGAFRYPLSSIFMPSERIDKAIESNLCIGKETGFVDGDFRRYKGYFRYREVYSGLRFCAQEN